MPISKIENSSIEDTAIHGVRNLIINGAMQVAQRGTSFTGLSNGNNQYTLDRWKWAETATPPYTMSVEQSSTSPDGFSNSLKVTTTSGGTLASDDLCRVFQGIEAQNLQHLQYGSSSAQSLTLSFYVRSNVTGTYVVHFYQDDGGPRNITRTYTISAADTWEYKTLTIPGDTAGAIDDNNGRGLNIEFILLAGSDYKGTTSTTWGSVANARYANGQTVDINTTNDTWFLSGCQLEVGDTATPFEHRSFGDELKKCERYYQQLKALQTSSGTQTTQVLGVYQAATAMRASATVGSSGALQVTDYGNTSKTQSSANISFQHSGNNDFSNRYYPIRLQNFSGLNTHRLWQLYNNTNYIDLDAEL
jgi:hypothetical protein